MTNPPSQVTRKTTWSGSKGLPDGEPDGAAPAATEQAVATSGDDE